MASSKASLQNIFLKFAKINKLLKSFIIKSVNKIDRTGALIFLSYLCKRYTMLCVRLFVYHKQYKHFKQKLLYLLSLI